MQPTVSTAYIHPDISCDFVILPSTVIAFFYLLCPSVRLSLFPAACLSWCLSCRKTDCDWLILISKVVSFIRNMPNPSLFLPLLEILLFMSLVLLSRINFSHNIIYLFVWFFLILLTPPHPDLSKSLVILLSGDLLSFSPQLTRHHRHDLPSSSSTSTSSSSSYWIKVVH